MSTPIRPATPSEIGIVCETLAAGFFDDRLIAYMFPDPDRRSRWLPGYFAPFVELAVECGGALIVGDYRGAGLSFPPGFSPGSPELGPERNRELYRRIIEGSGPDGLTVLAVERCLADHHPAGPPHQHAMYLSIRPEWRGQGYGAVVHKAWWALLDAANLPAYGEATSPSNKAFYAHHGWVAYSEPFSPGGAPEVFPIWREPMAAPSQ